MNNTIPIVLSSNDNYILGLAATIKSIIENSSVKYDYVINILYTSISENNKRKISDLSKKNIEINFVNINEKLKTLSSLYTSNHISEEAYYRLFIPEIFPEYEKILYIDCDLIVQKDIAELYCENIDNFVLGAVLNPPNSNMKQYREEFLEVPENKYFNSGVLLINSKEFLEEKIKEKCFELLNTKIKKPPCWDQDLLNVACLNKVKYFDYEWNLQWTPIIVPNSFSKTSLENFKRGIKKCGILHYTTNQKPWNFKFLSLRERNTSRCISIWWHYIMRTGYKKEALKVFLKIRRKEKK